MRKVDPSLAHRLFYPDVPAVLCSCWNRRVSAMPVVSFASLSTRPPLVGVSCDKDSYTARLASDSGAFSLCFLDRRHVGAMAFLASRSGAETEDKLAASGLRYRMGVRVPAPVLLDSAAALECSLASRRKFGDHVLLVGRVRAARASGDFDGYWRFGDYRPILYTGWKDGLGTYGGSKSMT